MSSQAATQRITFKKILCLSDFSDASELALPFAINLSRAYDAKILSLHVLTPVPLAYVNPETAVTLIEDLEEGARQGMQRMDAQLMGVEHESLLVRDETVWSAVHQVFNEQAIDLVVLGTHGRTGTSKLLMGSVAEEIFRKSNVPVLTIGPSVRNGVHNGGHFQNVLFATDFGESAVAALPYALSIAEESQAKLYLLHVLPQPVPNKARKSPKESVADAMHRLQQLIPTDTEFWCKPEAVVAHGTPADSILEAAEKLGADLIVMGIHGSGKHAQMVAHFENSVAHSVASKSVCAVLTKRP